MAPDRQPISSRPLFSFVVYSLALVMMFLLIIIVLLYSITSSSKHLYDTTYSSSLTMFSSRKLKAEIYQGGRRNRLLFNYISNEDSSKRKPLQGQMKLESDAFGNTKPTLVFLSPFPESCLGAFESVIDELMHDFKISCINMRGFGKTTSTEVNAANQTLFDNLVLDLVEIVENQKPKGSLVLIGQELVGTLIYLLMHEKKEWVKEHLLGAILLNSPHPKIFSDLLATNNKQQEMAMSLFSPNRNIKAWEDTYYGSNVTSDWNDNVQFSIVKQYIQNNFIGKVGSDMKFSFPTSEVSTDYEDMLAEKILVVTSIDHPIYLYPYNIKDLKDVLTKEVTGGVWYARDQPLEFAETIRNFVFTDVMGYSTTQN